ncbi:MAG TPA: GAF domain-containing protein [Pyrinomonadaceae bacterium]|jgi:GAF domain-containing protein
MAKKNGSKKNSADTKKKKKPEKQAQEEQQAEQKTNGGGSLEEQLRAAVKVIDVAEILTDPLTRSIENLLRLAARSIGTDEASVLVRDGSEGGLKFMVALGSVADKLIGVKIPPGQGIAGFVFASGQPMAVDDAAKAGDFYDKVDELTQFSTQTILATPLRVNEETVGVLEFINRIGEPPYRPYTPEEMDQAAHFADAIATLVDAHETAGLIETLFEHSAPDGNGKGQESGSELRQWLKGVRSAPEHLDLLQLAVSLRDIASRGEAERELCRDVLEALARFTEKQSFVGMSYLGF